jgi:hypothetical protein
MLARKIINPSLYGNYCDGKFRRKFSTPIFLPKVMARLTKWVIENKVDRVKRNIQYPTVRIQGIETLPDTF